MIYSDLYIGQKRKIPTLIGVLLILFIVGFFLTLTNKSALPSRASKSNLKRIEVANLNPIQVSIYWQSQDKETGWIAYGEKENKLTGIALDDRDVAEKKSTYFNHYVTLKNLKPGQQYFYAVITAEQKVVKPDGSYFDFKTPLSSSAKTKLNPANGKVLQPNLSPLANAVVIINVDENTAPISTLTKDTGEWLIPLNSFYDKKSQEEKTFSGKEQATIEILSEDGQISTVINNLNNLSSNTETIIIGKNYNFLQGDSVLSASTGFNGGRVGQVEVIYPQEGALIPGRRPLIKGMSLPSAKVSITINSAKTYSAVVTADKGGNWSYLIPDNLELGLHTITIKTKDGQGTEKLLVRKFTIVANEGPDAKVLGTASGSPTLTVAPSPTTPVYNNPTVAPTVKPPVSGIIDILPIIGGLSLIIVGGGVLLVF
ncbi:fibronectin type III domain-containing protein [Candidatus Roizmanbacteria bacterium]|nr:fibronectin type III domain-containing protein [Candidatus Roizmanbacteria bacterium]